MKKWATSSSAISLLEEASLKEGKNLLAFSAGSDSTALFFLLLERNIPFDIAMVDYQLRKQSEAEVAYAKELAQKYGKKLHLKTAPLKRSNIEARARAIRYHFFETLIEKEGYTNLITAHHLDDLLEWFLMQMTKGAGLAELVGMESLQQREGYRLVRPLLLTPKKEIEAYLQKRQIKHFIDETNFDTAIRRNLFRHRFVKELTDKYAKGIATTFSYLLKDKKLLEPTTYSIKSLHFAKTGTSNYETKRVVDRLFKKLGYLLSSRQKEEMLEQKSGVIAGKFAFAIDEELVWAAPNVRVTIPKKEKERFRKAKIPAPLRGYIYSEGIDLQTIAKYREEARK